MVKKNRPAKLKHILFILVAMLVVYFSLSRVLIIRGDSIRSTVAVLVSPNDLQKNDIVTFYYEHPFLGDKKLRLVKRVKCLPNQYLLIQARNVFCDGVFLGVAKAYRENGEAYPVFTYDGLIPTRKYFLFGDSKDSFDSRYIGLVEAEQLEYKGIEVY